MFDRRQFLSCGLQFALFHRALRQLSSHSDKPAIANGLSIGERQILAALVDVIIPAGDGMPSATEAGGLDYLQYLGWQYQSIQEEIAGFLEAIRQAAIARFGREFLGLKHEQRVQLLADLQRGRAPSFAAFVGYVYEAYYTRPMVQGALSCPDSPVMVEELDTLLAPVRNMKRLYREVP